MKNSILLALFLAPTFAVSAEQILPDKLTSLPVLIRIPLTHGMTNCGTGLYLEYSNRVFLVTAAHVLFNSDSTNREELNGAEANLCAYFSGTDNVIIVDLKKAMAEGLLRRHRSKDVAVVGIGMTSDTRRTQLYNTIHCDNPAGVTMPVLATAENYVTWKEVQDASDTYTLGYPIQLLKTQLEIKIPSQVDFSRPLIRKGIISQHNQRTGKLIIDSGVFGGNSGGPVLVAEHTVPGVTAFKIAGIIIEYVPVLTQLAPTAAVTNSSVSVANSGYGVAEPIDYALELMRQ